MAALPAEILSLLNEQYKHEMSNYFRYTQRQTWADFRGLNNIAKFFDKEASGEAGHARKVLDYIHSRSESVTIWPYAFDDDGTFNSVTGLFKTALQVEMDTSERIKNIYLIAFDANDLQTCDWLTGGLLAEQTEEEELYVTILDRIGQLDGDPAFVHDLDIWIGEEYLD